jgi:hypothetical protein
MVITFVVLHFRPVAGNVSDFAAVCNTFIPYHCAAHTWSVVELTSGLALVGLSLLTVGYPVRGDLYRWYVIVGLTAFGLLGGVRVDRLRVPVLGVLAQGLNIYRLDGVLLPLALWGVLVPIFGSWQSWRRWVLLGLVGVLGYFVLGTKITWSDPGWIGPHGGHWMLVLAAGLVLGTLAVSLPRLAARQEWLVRAGMLGVAVGMTMSCLHGGTFKLRPFDPQFVPDRQLADWGAAVQRVVPPGQQLLAPPLAEYVRIVTGRGVIVDCKYAPYGGQPWVDFQARLTALGGVRQCVKSNSSIYNGLPVATVEQAAKRYGTGYVVVEEGQRAWLPQLRADGWTQVLGPVAGLDNVVLKAPPGFLG